MRGSQSSGPWNSVLAGAALVTLLVAGCTSPTEPAGGLRLEALTATSLTGTVGIEVTPVPRVRVTDAAGRPVPGVVIAFDIAGGGGTAKPSVPTDLDGSATAGAWALGGAVGAHTLTARSSGLVSVVFTAMAGPGAPAQIARVSGNNQIALVRVTLSQPLRVRVADMFGNPVPGAPVTFAVISGGGALDGGAAVTDSAGFATSGAWTLGPAQGPQLVRAEAENAQQTFTAIACGAACQLPQLVYVRDGQIFGTTIAGGEPIQLTAGGRDGEPAWSPDGRRIAFVSYDQNWGAHIYLMDAGGNGSVLRVSGFQSPAWSPDGRLLAVARNPFATGCVYECDVYLLSADDDGAAPVRLATMAAYPTWSPDGKRIAFVSLSGDDGYHALHVINADGSGETAITVRDEGGIFDPDWSPDGGSITFSKCMRGSCNLAVVSLGGGEPSYLLATGTLVFEPAWSPDGTWIAFTLLNLGAGSTRSIAYVAAASGGEPIPIVSSGYSPAWRPGAAGLRNP
jgi:Tol biopolymer transport system component